MPGQLSTAHLTAADLRDGPAVLPPSAAAEALQLACQVLNHDHCAHILHMQNRSPSQMHHYHGPASSSAPYSQPIRFWGVKGQSNMIAWYQSACNAAMLSIRTHTIFSRRSITWHTIWAIGSSDPFSSCSFRADSSRLKAGRGVYRSQCSALSMRASTPGRAAESVGSLFRCCSKSHQDVFVTKLQHNLYKQQSAVRARPCTENGRVLISEMMHAMDLVYLNLYSKGASHSSITARPNSVFQVKGCLGRTCW